MELNILHNYEFKDVLNTFPVLKETLDELDINLEDIHDGETMDNYFSRKSLSQEEVDVIIRKMNRKLQTHFHRTDEKREPSSFEKLTIREEEE